MIELRSPAKTNLFLEVPCRRPDGFHELDTVFVALSLADTLQIESASGSELSLVVEGAGPEVTSGPENLVWKAAAALRQRAGDPALGANLRLLKRIPAGGGLGGGSSNAAAALRGLNDLWELGLGQDDLLLLAAELGSDVAFFLAGGLQRGRGRGELLEPLPACPPQHLVLLFPEFGCPTPQVYRALAPFLPDSPASPRELLLALTDGDPRGVAEHLFNRLEQPALAEFPRLAELKQDLTARAGVLATLVSGSGSTLIALAANQDDAQRVAAELASEGSCAVAVTTES